MLIHPAPARAEGTSHLLLQHHSTDHNTVIHLVNAKPPHVSGVDLFMGNLRRATGKKSKKCIKLYTASKFSEVLREESICNTTPLHPHISAVCIITKCYITEQTSYTNTRKFWLTLGRHKMIVRSLQEMREKKKLPPISNAFMKLSRLPLVGDLMQRLSQFAIREQLSTTTGFFFCRTNCVRIGLCNSWSLLSGFSHNNLT